MQGHIAGALADRLWHTRGKELALGRVGSLAIVVTGDPWTDTAWREYCDLFAHMVAAYGPARALFNLSPRSGPTGPQRQHLIGDCYEPHGIAYIRRFVVLTDSPLVRGAVTALSWFARSYQHTMAESPAKAAEALTWLQESAEFDVREAVEGIGIMMDLVGYRRDLLPQVFWRLQE